MVGAFSLEGHPPSPKGVQGARDGPDRYIEALQGQTSMGTAADRGKGFTTRTRGPWVPPTS